jgi:nucleoside 2-deoxyribosyltransferase
VEAVTVSCFTLMRGGCLNIYVAASWRTPQQPAVVQALREAGHNVYDFRQDGFSWSQIGMAETPTLAEYLMKLKSHPRAREGFDRDMQALEACDACVLVLPSGRSAHLEFGYAIGKRKLTVVLFLEEPVVPDLMYLAADRHAVSITQAVRQLHYLGHYGRKGVFDGSR